MMAIIPISGIILYSNLVIGQAELSDIPEGYEPEYWEYYKVTHYTRDNDIDFFFPQFIYSPPSPPLSVYQIDKVFIA